MCVSYLPRQQHFCDLKNTGFLGRHRNHTSPLFWRKKKKVKTFIYCHLFCCCHWVLVWKAPPLFWSFKALKASKLRSRNKTNNVFSKNWFVDYYVVKKSCLKSSYFKINIFYYKKYILVQFTRSSLKQYSSFCLSVCKIAAGFFVCHRKCSSIVSSSVWGPSRNRQFTSRLLSFLYTYLHTYVQVGTYIYKRRRHRCGQK